MTPGLVQWVKGSGVAAAAAAIQSLAQELPFDSGTVPKKNTKEKIILKRAQQTQTDNKTFLPFHFTNYISIIAQN